MELKMSEKDKKWVEEKLRQIVKEEIHKAFILGSPAIVKGVTDAIKSSSQA